MISKYGSDAAISDEFPLPEEEVGTQARAERLRQAVDAAGGNAAVARKIGMPLSTIGRYLAGRDMKASAMVALATATGVRLEWLATGEGSRTDAEMHDRPAPQPAATAATPLKDAPNTSRKLFSQVSMDRLVIAYETALKAFAGYGNANPEPRRLLQTALLIYDEIGSPPENSPGHDPQDSPPGGRDSP